MGRVREGQAPDLKTLTPPPLLRGAGPLSRFNPWDEVPGGREREEQARPHPRHFLFARYFFCAALR